MKKHKKIDLFTIQEQFNKIDESEKLSDRDQLPYFHRMKGEGFIALFIKQQFNAGYTKR